MGKTVLLWFGLIALGVFVFAIAPRTPTLAATDSGAQSIYLANCSGCHGAAGEGAVNIAPPLAKNPYVTGNPKDVIQTMLTGMVGPVKERGATWNGSMPPWQGTLSNAQLASVISYIRTSWGNRAKSVSASQVAAQAAAASPQAAHPSTAAPAANPRAEVVYIANCSGCHGVAGQGAINIAPPLAHNASVTGNPNAVIRIVLDGRLGALKEHGVTWNGAMPPWKGTLSNAQLAAVITYIRTSWGNKASPVSQGQVAASK
ncbi:MAG TPA: c-type cytochrome [Candidatus Baltobacteraceae bacterium]|nr:c-type cytochrome [Candidatus Baltobacteraceae bacterium]